ncbi:SulP family inorganic anion transporter [Actinocorallia sp. A-T 12471]|uniref:SulP family inorganic anion transporter n=1 Tax=Actinocorallia sp. A-T 12471 TaxID=3089813 RepID=UPI0029CE4BD9|nr:SulP family inorganic anion transporter [Actinocorallia sp. A-T 12471]MDX6744160.1 SulP family inorganic anion transporter [Actinocorallia sp. A-T 12471]
MADATAPALGSALRGVPRAGLAKEVIAGITLAALAIPLNIGYAQIAGLPPVTGLYAAIVPMLVFALLCSSRQLVASPDAPIAALIGSLLAGFAAPGTPQYVELAYAQALVCAAVFLLFAVFRLGFLANFLSEPVLVGFIAGLAIEILTSQVKKILGIKTTAEDFFPELWQIITGIPDAVPWSVAVGVGTMAVIVGLRRYAPALPGPLIALVLATVAVAVAGLDKHGVSILGPVPSGLPTPHLPHVPLGQWAALIPGAVAICAVTLADGLLTARRYAERHGYPLDADRELRAFGFANVGAGFTQAMTTGSSASRTAAMDAAGSRSQIPSVVCAVVVAVLLAFFSGVLRYLPDAALAGIVAVAVVKLLDVVALRRLWRLRRSEFWIAVVCMVGVPVLGSLTAVVIAFLLSAVEVVRRASRPRAVALKPGPEGRFVRSDTPEAAPGLVICRFESDLFFANAATFTDRVEELAGDGVRWFVLDAGAITDVDTTGAQTLHEVVRTLGDRGVVFAVSRATGPLRDLLAHYGLADLPYYASNRAALDAYREKG